MNTNAPAAANTNNGIAAIRALSVHIQSACQVTTVLRHNPTYRILYVHSNARARCTSGKCFPNANHANTQSCMYKAASSSTSPSPLQQIPTQDYLHILPCCHWSDPTLTCTITTPKQLTFGMPTHMHAMQLGALYKRPVGTPGRMGRPIMGWAHTICGHRMHNQMHPTNALVHTTHHLRLRHAGLISILNAAMTNKRAQQQINR